QLSAVINRRDPSPAYCRLSRICAPRNLRRAFTYCTIQLNSSGTQFMFDESAEYYDLIYSAFKNYDAETAAIADILNGSCAPGSHVLDVGCGTGEHARILSERSGYVVDGLDINPAFVDIARRKLPKASVYVSNMIDFEIPTRYQAIICMFSSIGYVCTLENVTRTLIQFRKHLDEKGIVIVEPWFQPSAFAAGRVFHNDASVGDTTVSRMGTSTVDGKISRLQLEYMIGTPGAIKRASETHELGLFTVDEMTSCFVNAGMNANYDPEGPSGRGLYVATVA
ncbi:MAG: class I SAM-dependent methyltransferase, partial [Gemmatimonadaceae bacterium]